MRTVAYSLVSSAKRSHSVIDSYSSNAENPSLVDVKTLPDRGHPGRQEEYIVSDPLRRQDGGIHSLGFGRLVNR